MSDVQPAPSHIGDARPIIEITRGKPLNKRQVAKASTRSKVLGAARFLFVEIGYEATTIRDVAQRAGMSTGAIFATVKDKEELYREAVGVSAPTLHLADEIAMIMAQRPGWFFILKNAGRAVTPNTSAGFFATLHGPDYSPVRGTGQIYIGHGASPGAALRKCRLDCAAFNAEATQ